MKLSQLPFEKAFDSTFHHNFDFNDFLFLDTTKEYKSFYINKRLILNPSSKLKKYLRFLNNFVFEFADINTDVVFSYRKGKNAFFAVEKHAQNQYFFQTDIKNLFNHITSLDVKKILENNLNNTPISDIIDYQSQLLKLITVNNNLPVGFSTSPAISNTCLYNFDLALEEYCLKNEIIYTRYSDDLILSSNNKAALNDVHNIISEQLQLLFSDKIQINPKKTKYTHKGNKIKLLGMVILPSGKITIDKQRKQQLEVLLHFYINDKDKFSDYLNTNYNGNPYSISGQLNYINTIDKLYLNKLRKKYGNFVIDTFFHQFQRRHGRFHNTACHKHRQIQSDSFPRLPARW